MRATATALFYVWTLAAVVFGAFGLAAPSAEWGLAYGADPAGLAEGRVDVLNQYRFLRGVELGVGLLFLAFRREVLNDARFGLLFAVVVGAGSLGRLAGIALDGWPSLWVVGLLAVEAAAAITVGLHAQAQPRPAT